MLRITLSVFISIAVAANAVAAMLDVRGRLTDAQGQPENGTCLLRFHLTGPGSGSPDTWSESVYVPVENGIFRIVLGKDRPIPGWSLDDGFELSVEAPHGSGWQAMASPVSPEAPRSTPREPERSAPITGSLSPGTQESASRPTRAQPRATRPLSSARETRPVTPENDETSRLKARVAALERQLSPATETHEVRARVYEVQQGDTLQSVAAKLWGDSTRWADLYNSNADRILRGGDLQPGQKLIVPELGR